MSLVDYNGTTRTEYLLFEIECNNLYSTMDLNNALETCTLVHWINENFNTN